MNESITMEVGRQNAKGEWLTLSVECLMGDFDEPWAMEGVVTDDKCLPAYARGQTVPLTEAEQWRASEIYRRMAAERAVELETLRFESRRERMEDL